MKPWVLNYVMPWAVALIIGGLVFAIITLAPDPTDVIWVLPLVAAAQSFASNYGWRGKSSGAAVQGAVNVFVAVSIAVAAVMTVHVVMTK